MEMKFLRAILKKTIEDAIRNTIIRLTQNKGTFLPKIEEISGGKAHTNTRKLNHNISTITDVFLSQKRVNV